MRKDASRAKSPRLRVFDAYDGYLIKYRLPAPEAGAAMASAYQLSTPLDPRSQALPRKRPKSPARAQAAEYRPSFRDRSPGVRKMPKESGRAVRCSRSLPRSQNPARADVLIDKDVRETRTAA